MTHSWFCSALTDYSWRAWGTYGVLRIVLRWAAYKAKALPTVLLIWPSNDQLLMMFWESVSVAHWK